MAKISKAKMEANRRWNEANYFRVALNIPKSWEHELKQYAKDNGTTVNKLLNAIIANLLGKESNRNYIPPEKITSTSVEKGTSTSVEKPPITPEIVAKWAELHANGLSFDKIVKSKDGLGYQKSTIFRRVIELREKFKEQNGDDLS